MNATNILGDVFAILAGSVAFAYVVGIWHLVKAPSRLMLCFAVGYMVGSRLLILGAETVNQGGWIEVHRSLLVLPVYPLLAVAFGMTYYKRRTSPSRSPRTRRTVTRRPSTSGG